MTTDAAQPCTCGSGAHPRRCERHPEHLRVHGALLSIEGYLHGNEEALGAVDELISALRHEYAWSDALIHSLGVEANRLQARVDELEECERESARIARETVAEFMERPLVDDDGHAEFERLQLRIAVLESSGAAAFNSWRTSSDVIGAMHVLREVVGAEFVDEQRKLRKP